MIRAEQALLEILEVAIDEGPQEVLTLKARAIIEKFKADSAAFHRRFVPTENTQAQVASDLAKLRDVVDQEIDRRVDEDLADSVCDLLEHLSDHLHAETGTPAETATNVEANTAASSIPSEAERRRAMTAEAAYLRAEQRHFEPGHEVEDWLDAESALRPRFGRSS